MKVTLKTSIYEHGPQVGDVGEALYFRYDDLDNLRLIVLFYGWPGTYEVAPQDVDPILQP